MYPRYLKYLILLCCILIVFIITKFVEFEVKFKLIYDDFYYEDKIYQFEFDDVFGDNDLELPGYYRKLDNNSAINQEVVKYIYINHDFWGMFGNMSDMFNNCPVNNCVVTFNKILPMERFDAIIFSRYAYYFEIPNIRSALQKYVYLTLDSPYNLPDVHGLSNFYNWTMTYKRDADIHFPHRVIRKKKTNYVLSMEKIRKKTKLIAWFVNNCHTEGTRRRSSYVNELMKYVPVDIYGDCGSLKCTNCYEMLESDYLFYLSFENNMCFDYVSEKVFNVLTYDVIPIVMGFADYSSIVPPNSVINIDDFPSPKALADYLLKIINNIGLYLGYLQWKKDYVVDSPFEYGFCQLCDLLHRPIRYSNYENFTTWFKNYNCYIYSSVT